MTERLFFDQWSLDLALIGAYNSCIIIELKVYKHKSELKCLKASNLSQISRTFCININKP